MLPRTLRLRPGVRVDDGQLEFRAKAEPTNRDVSWTVDATLANLAGSDGRRVIRWQQPVQANLRFASAAQGLQVRQFSLAAPFASADVKTERDAIAACSRVEWMQKR